eukprot:s7373_g1.t1
MLSLLQDQETNIEAIRQEAAAALCKAMEEGSLEAALAQAKGQKDVDVHVLKQEAATALLQAAQDLGGAVVFGWKAHRLRRSEVGAAAGARISSHGGCRDTVEGCGGWQPGAGTARSSAERGFRHYVCRDFRTGRPGHGLALQLMGEGPWMSVLGPLSVVFSQEPVDEDSLSKAKPVEQGKDIEAIRQAAARSLLKAAEDT